MAVSRARRTTPARAWYTPLRELVSKGSVTENRGGLAGIAEARREHQGQFFTPDRVVAFIWRLLKPVLTPDNDWQQVSIFDNSFGSGRLFQFANPKQHMLYGIEVDEACVRAVRQAAEAADFSIHLVAGSMTDYRVSGMDVAIINPPFSVHIDSPLVEAFHCNTWGKYGRQSATISHRYALAQALQAAHHVVAIVPRGFVADVIASEEWSDRLYQVIHLPPKSFAEEGTDWPTSLLIFQSGTVPPGLREEITLATWDEADAVTSDLTPRGWRRSPTITHAQVGLGTPAELLPVTGDRSVRIAHHNRRLVLQFRCGLTQAMVLNRVYRTHVSSTRDDRYAPGVLFDGQGQLDLENHLFTGDPLVSFGRFVSEIRSWGFTVTEDPGIRSYLLRAHRRATRLRLPLRHVAYKADGGLRDWLRRMGTATGTLLTECRESTYGYYREHSTLAAGTRVTVERVIERAEEPTAYGSGKRRRKRSSWNPEPQGESVTFRVECREGDRYVCLAMTLAELVAQVRVDGAPVSDPTWQVVHGGLKDSLPELYRAQELKARRLGIDRFLTWGFQFDDLVEMSLGQGNTICAWDMGLGKARLAVALCLMGGRHNLIVVEARLVDEMRTELKGLPIPASDWQVIDKPCHLRALRRVNVISINQLKAPLAGGAAARTCNALAKRTYAKELRHRIHTLVVDEAQMLRNPGTDQSRAVLAIGPKMTYDLSGTPIANYPRDILPLLQHVAGDGTAVQHYGLRHPFMHRCNLEAMSKSRRGIDVFAGEFVTVEWVTNEFAEDGRSGAKREIPRIRDVLSFRSLLAPRVKRRVMEEPEVAAHIRIPTPREVVTTLEWDQEHFDHYVAVVEQFKQWFDERKEYAGQQGKSLIMLLAKIQAVVRACTFPQQPTQGVPAYTGGLTSKQRTALTRLRDLTKAGHKTICFAASPALLDLFAAELGRDGIETVSFHGGITLDRRVRDLDRRFRNGSAPILLASKGCLQTGYNLWQADRALFVDRDWTPRVESQAAARLLRPQQTKEVVIEFLHLAGSIDLYQDQMVRFKANAITSGLDFGDDETEGEQFLHLETILKRFCDEFARSRPLPSAVREKGRRCA